jgi:two-component system, cell cycle response regulator
MNKLRNEYTDLDELHLNVNQNKLARDELFARYTTIIDNVFHIIDKMSFFKVDQELSSSISSLVSMLRYKELIGQERAIGSVIIEEHMSDEDNLKLFFMLKGAQNAHLDSYMQTATLAQKIYKDKVLSPILHKKIADFESKIDSEKYTLLSAQVWFDTMTLYMDELKQVSDELAHNINTLVIFEGDSALKEFIWWTIYVVLLLMLSLVVAYLFKESSSWQIHTVTKAMRKMASGERGVRLYSPHIDDEISQMIKAYELSRQNLLKGDIFAQLYSNKKDIELEGELRKNQHLEEIAFVDSLTGCINRRKFEELAHIELERQKRYKQNLSFLMLDIDYFKKVNDTYGHAVGDEVLKQFSKICRDRARAMDTVARIGGEEFVIMLPETSKDAAYQFADMLREKIANSAVEVDGISIKYSVSIGVCFARIEDDNDLSLVLENADKALYQAKKEGRNRVVIYEQN